MQTQHNVPSSPTGTRRTRSRLWERNFQEGLGWQLCKADFTLGCGECQKEEDTDNVASEHR